MKEIVVISGKGGTGKTSVTASLALLAGRDAVVADCDVDAADLHLLLAPDPDVEHPFAGGTLAVVDTQACSGCGACEQACRFEAIVVENGVAVVDDVDCEGCGYCARVCPEDAIVDERQTVGYWQNTSCRTGGAMVHARLGIGADNSGKLVAKVKAVAREEARARNTALVLVDGAPGVGCPVVSSLSGADLVLLVTEPSVAGLHDLQRVYQLVASFKLPAACILNKADLHEGLRDQVLEFLTAEGIPLLAELPYTTAVPAALAAGKTMLEWDISLAARLRAAWQGVAEQLQQSGRTP